MVVIDKNIPIWELFAGRLFLGGYLHMGGKTKGDKVLAFLPGLMVPRKQTDRWYHSLRSAFSWEEDQFKALDKLNRDTLRYLIVIIYRDVKPESNNQGRKWWCLAQ